MNSRNRILARIKRIIPTNPPHSQAFVESLREALDAGERCLKARERTSTTFRRDAEAVVRLLDIMLPLLRSELNVYGDRLEGMADVVLEGMAAIHSTEPGEAG